MNRAGILATVNRRFLEAYSRRTTQTLRNTLRLPLALPWLERLLVENVAKEVQKDSLVIARAAAAVASGESPGEAVLATLLAATKEIDRAFLSGVSGIPLDIVIRYEQIEPMRYRRIERLLTESIRVLEVWQGRRGLRSVLSQSYSGMELERLLLDLLNLYAQETKVLGEAVRLPRLLVPLRAGIVCSLFRVMQDAAGQLAAEWAVQAHGKGGR